VSTEGIARYLMHSMYPSKWAREICGWTPDYQQAQFLDLDRSDVMLNWCRQSGKTTTTAYRVAHSTIFRPNHQTLVVSATQRQAGILQRRTLAIIHKAQSSSKWRKVKDVQVPSDPMDLNSEVIRCSVLSLELANGSEVISCPASEDSVRGYSPDLLVGDEASRIPDSVYDAIGPMRAAKSVKLLLLTTPNGRRGYFYREWSGNDALWWRSQVTADECPRITRATLDRERGRMTSDAMYQQEYYCKFIDLQGALFTDEQIKAMFVTPEGVTALKPHVKDMIVDGLTWR
jgi:hypothetical protein